MGGRRGGGGGERREAQDDWLGRPEEGRRVLWWKIEGGECMEGFGGSGGQSSGGRRRQWWAGVEEGLARRDGTVGDGRGRQGKCSGSHLKPRRKALLVRCPSFAARCGGLRGGIFGGIERQSGPGVLVGLGTIADEVGRVVQRRGGGGTARERRHRNVPVVIVAR